MSRIQAAALGCVAVCMTLLSGGTGAGAAPTDWPSYHHDGLRSGRIAMSTSFNSSSAPAPAWTFALPSTRPGDRILAEPLIVGGVVYIATESNHVIALRESDGVQLWSSSLGLSFVPGNVTPPVCGNIRPTIGITSTPVVDLTHNRIYVVSTLGGGARRTIPIHHLEALDLSNGAVVFNRTIDPGPGPNVFQLQRPGLAKVSGRIIVGYGGNAGDCGTYHGWIESISATDPTAPIDSFKVAAHAGGGGNGGAVWMGAAAPAVDSSGNVFLATGNSNSVASTDPYDHSDSVLRLSATLSLEDFFAPSNFYADNAKDLDLGSGLPQILAGGDLLQVGKSHKGYLLSSSALGGVTGLATTLQVCVTGQANGGDAVISDSATTSVVVVPCTSGLEAVTVTHASHSAVLSWTSADAQAPPIVAGGAVEAVHIDGATSSLVWLDPTTGATRYQVSIGPVGSNFITPAASASSLVVAGSRHVYDFVP